MIRRIIVALAVLACGLVFSAGSGAVVLRNPHWTVGSYSPLGPRNYATVAWDGRELLELGGISGAPHQGPQSDGAAYDPASNQWRMLPDAPPGLALLGAVSAWTGQQLFVIGAQSPRSHRLQVALLDPSRNRWSTLARPLPALEDAQAVWTGRRIIVAGVTSGRHGRLAALAVDPAHGTWKRLHPPVAKRHQTAFVSLLATPRGVVLWSLWSHRRLTGPGTVEVTSGIDVFRLTGVDRWADLGRWPAHQMIGEPILTGRNILVPAGQMWCGFCHGPIRNDHHGLLANTKTLRVSRIPHGPVDGANPYAVWTGSEEVALAEQGVIFGPTVHIEPGDVAFWNPATRLWTTGPTAPSDPVLPPIWDGSEMLVIAANGQAMRFGG